MRFGTTAPTLSGTITVMGLDRFSDRHTIYCGISFHSNNQAVNKVIAGIRTMKFVPIRCGALIVYKTSATMVKPLIYRGRYSLGIIADKLGKLGDPFGLNAYQNECHKDSYFYVSC